MGWSKYLKFSHIVHIDLSCFCNILAPHFQTEKKKKKKKNKDKKCFALAATDFFGEICLHETIKVIMNKT